LSAAGLASIAFVPISIYFSSLIVWFVMLAHLIPLTLAHFQLRRHTNAHPQTNLGRWLFFGPSMYFGWISAATIISTALMANEVGIVVSDSVATGIAIAVAISLAGFAIWMTLRSDPIYGATIAWALLAIGVEQKDHPAVRYTALAAAAVITVTVALQLSRRPIYFPLFELSQRDADDENAKSELSTASKS